MKIFWLIFGLVLIGDVLVGVESRAEHPTFILDRGDQKSLVMTVYNGNFALIQETRDIELPRGLVAVEYRDVARFIEPSSLILRSGGHGDGQFLVLEQSYQRKLINRNSLLTSYLGKKITYSRNVANQTGEETVVREGELLAINPEIVRFPEGVEIDPEGTISVPALPENLELKPVLKWLLDNKVKGFRSLQTSYLTDNIGWQADYVVMLDENKMNFDLDSWITINNQSGTEFKDVKIQVVAGEVNRKSVIVRPEMRRLSMVAGSSLSADVQAGPVFEYHQYDLSRRTDLKDGETKQIHFQHADNVEYVKTYRLTSQSYNYQMQEAEKSNVDVRISFVNSARNRLGQPFPQGNVRVYVLDEGGLLRFVGEDLVKHTPANQKIDLELGAAFDITSVREQTYFRRLRERQAEASYVIELTNSKKEAVDVIVEEKLQGDWQIIEESEPGKRIDSRTYEYTVSVPAAGSKTVSYTVWWQY